MRWIGHFDWRVWREPVDRLVGRWKTDPPTWPALVDVAVRDESWEVRVA
jgi:hypothetical protein